MHNRKYFCTIVNFFAINFETSIRENNAKEILKIIATNKILIGWSAAAFVFGPTLELLNCYSPEMNFLKMTDLKGLGLTQIEVLPHYDKFINRFDKFEETCREYESKHNVKVIRINDGDGIVIEDENVCCI